MANVIRHKFRGEKVRIKNIVSEVETKRELLREHQLRFRTEEAEITLINIVLSYFCVMDHRAQAGAFNELGLSQQITKSRVSSPTSNGLSSPTSHHRTRVLKLYVQIVATRPEIDVHGEAAVLVSKHFSQQS
jgi:hypothetical protein